MFQKHEAVEEITVSFIQPYCNYVTLHTFTRGDMSWMVSMLCDLIAKRKDALANPFDASRRCVNAMCQFCARAANGDCPALREKAAEVARSYVESDVVVPSVTHGSQTDDPEVIAANYKLARLLEPFIEGAKLRAQRLYFEEGIDLPGYTPVERKGRKTVKANEAWSVFQEILPGAPVEEFIALTKDISFNDLADLAKERAPRGKKTQAVAELESRLRSTGSLTESSPARFFAAIKED